MTKALAVGVLLSTVVVGLPSAQRAAPQRDSSTLSSTVTAVLVDVVVRDRNGRPVLDLDAADFSLAEDGVPHKVESFTRISRGAGIGVSVAWRAGQPLRIALPTGDAFDVALADHRGQAVGAQQQTIADIDRQLISVDHDVRVEAEREPAFQQGAAHLAGADEQEGSGKIGERMRARRRGCAHGSLRH